MHTFKYRMCLWNSFETGKCCTLVMQLLHIKSMPFCSFVRPSVLPRVWYWLTSSFLSYVVVNDYVCTFGTGTFLNKHRHRPRKDLLVCRLAGCTSATFPRFVVAKLHLMFNPKMQFCVFVKLLQWKFLLDYSYESRVMSGVMYVMCLESVRYNVWRRMVGVKPNEIFDLGNWLNKSLWIYFI